MSGRPLEPAPPLPATPERRPGGADPGRSQDDQPGPGAPGPHRRPGPLDDLQGPCPQWRRSLPLRPAAAHLRGHVGQFLRERLAMEMPPRRETHYDDETKAGDDAILSRFHNPFEVIELFDGLGFEDMELLWYHYHLAMPLLAEKDPPRSARRRSGSSTSPRAGVASSCARRSSSGLASPSSEVAPAGAGRSDAAGRSWRGGHRERGERVGVPPAGVADVGEVVVAQGVDLGGGLVGAREDARPGRATRGSPRSAREGPRGRRSRRRRPRWPSSRR